MDIERDILNEMAFRPAISGDLAPMDHRIFEPGPMHYREEWLSLPLEARLTYEPSENLFFINFEGLSIRRAEDVENVRRAVEQRLSRSGARCWRS